MLYDIFISYSRKDSSEVDALINLLRSEMPQIKIWYDIDGIETAEAFRTKIIKAIDESKTVIFVCSDNSLASEFCEKEVMYAKNTSKTVIPYLLTGVDLKGWLLFEFGTLNCIHSDKPDEVGRMLRDIRRWTSGNVQDEEQKTFQDEPRLKPLEPQHGLELATEDPVQKNQHGQNNEQQKNISNNKGPHIIVHQIKSETTTLEVQKSKNPNSESEQQNTILIDERSNTLESQLKPNTTTVEVQPQNNPSSELEQQKSVPNNTTPSSLESQLEIDPAKGEVQKKKNHKNEITLSRDGLIDGHYYVDLGLPSGIKWATNNVGACQPEQSGLYFAWGEIFPKKTYLKTNCDTYFDPQKSNWFQRLLQEYISENIKLLVKGYVGMNYILKSLYDAARMNWGGSWRMPTEEELYELVNNTTSKWITYKGVSGRLIKSKINGKSIFLPAAGYQERSEIKYEGEIGAYWSSTPDDITNTESRYLHIAKDRKEIFSECRSVGCPIRPVWKEVRRWL